MFRYFFYATFTAIFTATFTANLWGICLFKSVLLMLLVLLILIINIQLVFKYDFAGFSQKSHLNRILVCFSLVLCCIDVPMLVFAAWLVQEPYEGEFPNLFPNLLRLFPNLSPNFHCFHHEWGLSLRISNGCRSFQKIFQIHIIYNNKREYCPVFIKRLAF